MNTYLDKKIKELADIINEGKKRNKITKCNEEIIKKIYFVFNNNKIEEEEKNKENSENKLYDINEIKAKAKEIFSLNPSDEDKKEIFKKKSGKKNRLDDLIGVIITLIDDNFIEDFNKVNESYKIDKKSIKKKKEEKNEGEDKNEKINKDSNYAYFNSNFSEYINQYKKEKFKDQINNESEEAKNLIQKEKSDYLHSKVEEKGFSLFEKDLDEVIKKYQNSKCKKKVFEFCKSKDIKGLLLILNFIRPVTEKEKLNINL